MWILFDFRREPTDENLFHNPGKTSWKLPRFLTYQTEHLWFHSRGGRTVWDPGFTIYFRLLYFFTVFKFCRILWRSTFLTVLRMRLYMYALFFCFIIKDTYLHISKYAGRVPNALEFFFFLLISVTIQQETRFTRYYFEWSQLLTFSKIHEKLLRMNDTHIFHKIYVKFNRQNDYRLHFILILKLNV